MRHKIVCGSPLANCDPQMALRCSHEPQTALAESPVTQEHREVMAKRKFQIDQLIINSPYEEPSTYWSYDREIRMFERKDGRRPAGYVVATPGSKAFDDPGEFVELPLVNKIRPRVEAWVCGGLRDHQAAAGTLARPRRTQGSTVLLLPA